MGFGDGGAGMFQLLELHIRPSFHYGVTDEGDGTGVSVTSLRRPDVDQLV